MTDRRPPALAPELKEILACRLAFRIDDGIPVMLLDEAKPLT